MCGLGALKLVYL